MMNFMVCEDLSTASFMRNKKGIGCYNTLGKWEPEYQQQWEQESAV
jgi:hypothetical protein